MNSYPDSGSEAAEPSRSAAAALAARLLTGIDTRLAHSARVASQMERVVDLLDPDWRSPALDAAWLHDIGYHPDLATTGFHPLDGARYLGDHGWRVETCCLVAWHSESIEEARMLGLEAELITEFDAPPHLPAAALTWADLTSSPTGDIWDPERRLAEILARYPPGSLVHDATRGSLPALSAAARDIDDLRSQR